MCCYVSGEQVCAVSDHKLSAPVWGHQRSFKGCCSGRPRASDYIGPLCFGYPVRMCLCSRAVWCPPLNLPPPNRPTELSRECRRAFDGEIKDKCILRKAVKFTGRGEREGQRVPHSTGFGLWTSPPGCILRPSVPEEDKVPLISVHILLWCSDVSMLMFRGCCLHWRGCCCLPTHMRHTHTFAQMLGTFTKSGLHLAFLCACLFLLW